MFRLIWQALHLLMLRGDSLSSPTCQQGTRVWVSVSPTPHPEYIRASFQQQPLSLPSPPPWAPLLWGVKVWHQGQLGGEEAHSTSGAFCLTHHFPLCPGSPCQPWVHPSWLSGAQAAAGLCGLLTPLPAGMSEDWVQSPAWLLPACVMLHRLSLSCFICLVGQGRLPSCADRGFMTKCV